MIDTRLSTRSLESLPGTVCRKPRPARPRGESAWRVRPSVRLTGRDGPAVRSLRRPERHELRSVRQLPASRRKLVAGPRRGGGEHRRHRAGCEPVAGWVDPLLRPGATHPLGRCEHPRRVSPAGRLARTTVLRGFRRSRDRDHDSRATRHVEPQESSPNASTDTEN